MAMPRGQKASINHRVERQMLDESLTSPVLQEDQGPIRHFESEMRINLKFWNTMIVWISHVSVCKSTKKNNKKNKWNSSIHLIMKGDYLVSESQRQQWHNGGQVDSWATDGQTNTDVAAVKDGRHINCKHGLGPHDSQWGAGNNKYR